MVPTPAAGSGSLEQFVKAKATDFWAESGLRGQASEARAAREEAALPHSPPTSMVRLSLVEMNSFGFVLGWRGGFPKSAQ